MKEHDDQTDVELLWRKNDNVRERTRRAEKLADAVKTILECVGEDPTRNGLVNTPMRYATALLYFTKGYEECLETIVNGAMFKEGIVSNSMVIVKDIEFSSLCAHHLVPFVGKLQIGYVPKNGRVIGLSKIARIVEMYARRLQIQERLGQEVARALQTVLSADGVAVVVESSHLCMVMRGVQKTAAVTTTSCWLGCLKDDAEMKKEFFQLIRR